MKNKRGVSLIVLVITIIVIIILAAAVILTLTDNNPIDNAKKATFINDVGTFQSELDIYKANKYTKTLGDYNSKKLDADETTLNYNDEKQSTDTMYNVITSLKGLSKYQGKFEIIDGELWYKSTKNSDWAEDAGIKVDDGIPKTKASTVQVLPVKTGVNVEYIVEFSSNVGLPTIDLTNKVLITDESGVAIATQPTYITGIPTGTVSDTTRTVNLTINTTELTEGKYKVKILAGAVTNANEVVSDKDILSITSFEIDNTAPNMPIINLSPEGYTAGNLTVTITPTVQGNKLEYSVDGTNYQTYTSPFNISDNLTVSAREIDKATNVSNISSLLITTIDKTPPTIIYGTNGATGITVANTVVTVNDVTGIKSGTLQYSWDTQNLTEPLIGWTTFASEETITKTEIGTYYLWVKAEDNLGNKTVNKSNAFIIQGTSLSVELNPLDVGSNIILSNNNQTATNNNSWWTNSIIRTNISKNTGKWYYEVKHLSGPTAQYIMLGIGGLDAYIVSNSVGLSNNCIAYYPDFPINSIVGVAFDIDSRTVQIYKDGVLQSTNMYRNVFPPNGTNIYPLLSIYLGSYSVNFGSTPFVYTMPSGYQAFNKI